MPARLHRLLVAAALGLALALATGCDTTPEGEFVDVALRPDGRIATTGFQAPEGDELPALQAITANGGDAGKFGLNRRLPLVRRGVALATAATLDGRATIVAGSAELNLSGFAGRGGQAFVGAVDDDERFIWTALPLLDATSSALTALAVSADTIYATGLARVVPDGAADPPVSGSDLADQGIAIVALRKADGSTRWARAIELEPDLLARRTTSGLSIALDGDGRLAVTGLATQASGSVAGIVAVLDTDGTVQWISRLTGSEDLGGDAGHLNVMRESAFDATGNLYAAGVTFEGLEGSDGRLVSFAPDGTVLWDRSIDVSLPSGRPSYDRATSVAVAAGRACVGGQVARQSGPASFIREEGFVQCYATGSGALLWQSDFVGASQSGEAVEDLVVAADGSVYAAGSSSSNGIGRDLAVQRFDARGAARWIANLDVPGTGDGDADIDRIRRLVLAGDQVVVVGTANLIPTLPAAVAVSLDAATGQRRWVVPASVPLTTVASNAD